MRRTWIVYVEREFELDAPVKLDYFGPFTKEQALTLEIDLNKVLGEQKYDGNNEQAVAIPLSFTTTYNVLERYRNRKPEGV